MVWFLYIIGAVLFYMMCIKESHPCIVLLTSLFWPFVVPVCLVIGLLDVLDEELNKKGER